MMRVVVPYKLPTGHSEGLIAEAGCLQPLLWKASLRVDSGNQLSNRQIASPLSAKLYAKRLLSSTNRTD
jgi:hypothetical protein